MGAREIFGSPQKRTWVISACEFARIQPVLISPRFNPEFSMPRFMALMFAAVIGAVLGTSLRPGIPEILIVAVVLTGLFSLRQSFRRKRRVAA